MDADWTASALFSPSKARVQQAQAKDWAAVDSWLSRRYGARVPPFERNEETLQALLTLANFNESADEQRSQVERIEKAAYQSLTRRPGKVHEEILQPLRAELANESSLDALAETAVALDCPTVDAQAMARGIIALGAEEFETQQQVKRLEAQLVAMRAEGERVRDLMVELQSDTFQAPVDMAENTVEWNKSSKTLKAKISEYEERLSATRATSSNDDFETIQRKMQNIATTKARLQVVEQDMKAFQDLPTDPRAARRKLEAARDRLRQLTVERDRLFEALVDG